MSFRNTLEEMRKEAARRYIQHQEAEIKKVFEEFIQLLTAIHHFLENNAFISKMIGLSSANKIYDDIETAEQYFVLVNKLQNLGNTFLQKVEKRLQEFSFAQAEEDDARLAIFLDRLGKIQHESNQVSITNFKNNILFVFQLWKNLLQPSLNYIIAHVNDRNKHRFGQDDIALKNIRLLKRKLNDLLKINESSAAMELGANNTHEINQQDSSAISTTSTINIILPEETFAAIFTYLNTSETCKSATLTCSMWHRISNDASVIKEVKHAPRNYNAPLIEKIRTFNAGNNTISNIEELADGTLVTYSNGPIIRLLDRKTGECLTQFNLGLHVSVRFVAEIEPGKIVSGGSNNKIIVWDIQSGKNIKEINTGSHRLTKGIIVSKNILWTGSASGSDGTLRIWDLTTSTSKVILNSHLDLVTCLQQMPNGNILCGMRGIGGSINTLQIWDAKKEACLSEFDRSKIGGVSSADSLENNLIAVIVEGVQSPPHSPYDFVQIADASKIQIWNSTNNTCVQTLAGHFSRVSSIVALSDREVMSLSAGNILRIWDLTTLESNLSLTNLFSKATCIKRLANGNIAWGSSDGYAHILPFAFLNPEPTIENKVTMRLSAVSNR